MSDKNEFKTEMITALTLAVIAAAGLYLLTRNIRKNTVPVTVALKEPEKTQVASSVTPLNTELSPAQTPNAINWKAIKEANS